MTLPLADEPAREPTYRAWPRWSPHSPELGAAGPRALLATGAILALITAFLCVPAVARTMGLPARATVAIMAAYFAAMCANDLVLHPWAVRSKRGFDAQLVIVPIYNVAFLSAFVLVPNEPRTPLWMGLLMYTATTATWQEVDKTWAFLAFHALTPLLTIPVFLARGAPAGWSITAPALCALLSAVSYHLVGLNTVRWQRLRAAQARTIGALRARAAETERRHLAQDLHDSVGAALGLVSLYGELVERHAHDPAALRELATTLREAATDGLSELRGVLSAMSPERADVATLARDLRRVGGGAASAASATLTVSVDDGASEIVDGAARLALVRVFREALSNALRHGRATRVEAKLAAPGDGTVRLSIADDGAGFEVADRDGAGRGLPGMRRRAADLGGACVVTSGPGGTRVVFTVPRAPR